MSNEGMGITMDTSPYLIFRCERCGQYMYVKPGQKTKKCLRCNRHYKVSKIQQNLTIEEVKGMSAAVERVKELQHQFAEEELGTEPDLTTLDRFTIASELPKKEKRTEKKLQSAKNNCATLEEKFTYLLCKLSKKYNTFPRYLIGLASTEYGIKSSELDILVRRFVKQGKLISTDNYFRFKTKKKEENKEK